MFYRKEKNSPKVVLPGEIRFTNSQDIGTFAVGASQGCRAYLAYDTEQPLAGLAHVDFHDQDVPAVANLLSELASMGATNLVVGSTSNANLPTILSELGANNPMTTLPDPEFSYNPISGAISNSVDMRDKRSAFAKKKHTLNKRMRSGKHDLLRD